MAAYFQLEELRADIVDLKEMYREQVNLLVNKVLPFNLFIFYFSPNVSKTCTLSLFVSFFGLSSFSLFVSVLMLANY
jgi:hypothetical protein